MAKWHGKIGYATNVETEPGYWETGITEREHYGEVISDRMNRQNSGLVNDDINISSVISIISDSYVQKNCSKMLYVEYMGTKWKITSIEPLFPRLRITIGGIYNG